MPPCDSRPGHAGGARCSARERLETRPRERIAPADNPRRAGHRRACYFAQNVSVSPEPSDASASQRRLGRAPRCDEHPSCRRFGATRAVTEAAHVQQIAQSHKTQKTYVCSGCFGESMTSACGCEPTSERMVLTYRSGTPAWLTDKKPSIVCSKFRTAKVVQCELQCQNVRMLSPQKEPP